VSIWDSHFSEIFENSSRAEEGAAIGIVWEIEQGIVTVSTRNKIANLTEEFPYGSRNGE
jgi:hypothetical protein